MSRARPLSVEDRRRALVDATLPLLLEHGQAVTTRQIADAAGIAEGTIFRAFESKDALVQATVERAFDTGPFLADLAAIDPDQDLRDRLLALTTTLQGRFTEIFTLMSAMGMVGPPKHHPSMAADRAWANTLMVALVEPDSDRIACTPEELVRLIRMLTFSGTHPHIGEGQVLRPPEIVGVVLDGVLRRDDPRREDRRGEDDPRGLLEALLGGSTEEAPAATHHRDRSAAPDPSTPGGS